LYATGVTSAEFDYLDGVTSNIQTQLNDRYTESEIQTFMDNSYISKDTASDIAVGWYTIATNTGNRAVARFGIWDTDSGRHQSIIFYAAHKFGNASADTMTVIDAGRYSTSPFRYIRIKAGGTYDGAALQVYVDNASNALHAAILGDNFQSDGWVLCDFVPDADTPPLVSNYGSFTESSRIDLDEIAQGGFATTGPIYADGNTTQYKVITTNDFGIANTNPVKIDSSSVADNEYARFTASGLESRSTSEVLSDLSLDSELQNLSSAEIDYLEALYATGVTSAEFDFLDGVTSNIQTQLNAKQATIGDGDLTIARTSGLQAALDAKLASSSYTAADVLTKIKTVDGSGSGLDADTLDGVSSASFLRSDADDTASGKLTFTDYLTLEDTYLRVGDVTADNYTQLEHATSDGFGFDWASNNASVISNLQGSTNQAMVLGDVSATDSDEGLFGVSHSTNSGGSWTKKLDLKGNGALYVGPSAQYKVWTEGNDGSGSGLDADTLDGSHASSFVTSGGDASLTSVTVDSLTKIDTDGTYGASYGAIGIGTSNLTNGHHRIFAKSSDHMYFAAATSKGFRFRPNGGSTTASAGISINSSGYLGIGTTNASNYIDVNGGIAIGASYVGGSAPSNGAIIEGNLGVGYSSPSYKLHVNGSIVGSYKSFLIDHPTKEGKQLMHSCLEGPEHGVYLRGQSDLNIIKMPDYWKGLVHIDTMSVTLTAIGPNQNIYVDSIAENGDVAVGSNTEEPLNYFYVVHAERKDIDKLEIEIPNSEFG